MDEKKVAILIMMMLSFFGVGLGQDGFFDGNEVSLGFYVGDGGQDIESGRLPGGLAGGGVLDGLTEVGGSDVLVGEGVSDALTEEGFFDYEIRADGSGGRYAVLKGVREEYEGDFWEGYRKLADYGWAVIFPEQLEGVDVTELAACAFRDVPLGDYGGHLEISPGIVSIGEHCFENCGLADVSFGERGPGEGSLGGLAVHDRAFAGNPGLWGIYFSDREVGFGRGVFEGCAEEVYLCYLAGAEGWAGGIKAYALENGFNAVGIPAGYSDRPLVDYPETPVVLGAEVRDFFYGESASDEEKFCSFVYDGNAWDYGFPEWHLPCGEFCAMDEFRCDITASSELASPDGRYSAENLGYHGGRGLAWAEGVEGYGIGESISIAQRCGYGFWTDWAAERPVTFLEGDMVQDIYDGYMRYTEICVVNGYARDQKVWEENGRVKRLLMYVEGEPYAYLELEDTMRPQYFALPVDAVKVADGVDIHFKFVIEEIYPGMRYEDTCLTGLVMEFMGRRGH